MTKHKCEHEDCDRQGDPCFIDSVCAREEGAEPDNYFCPEHAFANGHCACCGEFWGGIEAFDFGNGLCEHCKSQVDENEYEDDFEPGFDGPDENGDF